MTNKKSHISKEDFSRYLNDQMTDLERNAFERELQKNPFEAEALEGFQQISNSDLATDLLDLKSKISHKKRQSKTRIWAAAASFLLLISAGVIWFQVKDKSPVPEMAETKTFQKEKTEIESGKSVISPDQQEKAIPAEEIREEPLVKKSVPILETPENEKSVSSSNPKTETDDKLEIVAFDTEIQEEDSDFKILAKPAKKEIITNETAEVLNQPVNQAKSLNRNISLNDSTENISLSKGNFQVNELSRSRNTAAGISTEKKAEPKIGLEEYNKYLQKEAIFPTNYKSKNDTVKMVLKIDTDGKITDIRYTNQADSILFERSKEIIRNGPEWNPEIRNGKKAESETEIILIFRKQD